MTRPSPRLSFIAVLAASVVGCSGSSRSSSAGGGAPAAPASLPAVNAPLQEAAGFHYQEIRVGRGAAVEPRQCVYVHYTGWLAATGRRFESSRDTVGGIPGRPLAFPQGANAVIAGWDRGVLGMRIGGERRLFLPSRMAYGTLGMKPTIPPHAPLIFDIEVVALARAGARPKATEPPRCPAWTG